MVVHLKKGLFTETSQSWVYNQVNYPVADGHLAWSLPASTTVYYFNKVSKKKGGELFYKDDDQICLWTVFCHKDGRIPSC